MILKIKKIFSGIFQLLKNPWLMNNILNDNSIWEEKTIKKHKINRLPKVKLLSLFDAFDSNLDYYTFLDGGSIPTDYLLLRNLAKQIPACKYFEIGTWRGESVANVAQYCSQCVTLNLSEEEMRAIKISENHIQQIGFFSKKIHDIKHIEGNSKTFDYPSLRTKFDLIFIDGDHSYDGVYNDTLNVLQHLCHENTIVVWHDYAFNPEKVRHEVLKAILDSVPNQSWRKLYHVENSLCAILLPDSISKQIGKTESHFPENNFKIHVSIDKID